MNSNHTPWHCQSPTNFSIINPHNSLSYLSPAAANDVEAFRYLAIATLSALIWDILTAMPDEILFLRRNYRGLTTFPYVVSRLSTLAYVSLAVVIQTGSPPSCHVAYKVVGSIFPVCISSTSMLFLARARRLLVNNNLLTTALLVLWIANTAISCLSPFAIDAKEIADTGHCTTTVVQPWLAAAPIMMAVFDTSIFVAISWKLVAPHAETTKDILKILFGERAVPLVARTLLAGGQQYYLVAISFNILQMILALAPGARPGIKAMFALPNVALTSTMACRVFRSLMLGRISADEVFIPRRQQYKRKGHPHIHARQLEDGGLPPQGLSLPFPTSLFKSTMGGSNALSEFKAPSKSQADPTSSSGSRIGRNVISSWVEVGESSDTAGASGRKLEKDRSSRDSRSIRALSVQISRTIESKVESEEHSDEAERGVYGAEQESPNSHDHILRPDAEDGEQGEKEEQDPESLRQRVREYMERGGRDPVL